MAASSASAPQGYQCDFVDPGSVPEDFYCKQCSLVARRLTITSCCGESYCNGCIYIHKQKPCPGCGTKDFQTFQHIKYQKKILNFQVWCSLKKRGCGWCGPLEHLAAHLDPDTGDCEYTDIDCPLKCHNKINKKDISDHIANECVKRDYVCPYCDFKGIYEIVRNIHWEECSHFPLICPNRCGVTCERTTMEEDHMKICPLQEVECQFKHVCCAEKFPRKLEEEHMTAKAQTHLLMMATESAKLGQDLQEQERKSQVQERKLQNQERKLHEQDWKLHEQKIKLHEQEKKLQEHEKKSRVQQKRRAQQGLVIQEKKLQEKFEEMLQIQRKDSAAEHGQLKSEVADLKRMCLTRSRSFTMEDFSIEKAKRRSDDWKSPPMYTHVHGYKFCIGVDANGHGLTEGKSMNVELWVMEGEYDDKLKWPVTARFTLELINHFDHGENKKCTFTVTWKRPNDTECLGSFNTVENTDYHFIYHRELPRKVLTRTQFLKNDSLCFEMTKITIAGKDN